MRIAGFTVLAVAMTLSACGGRVARPVAVVNPFDDSLSCTHIRGEFDNNLKRLTELTGESEAKVADNIGFLLVSPFFLDLSQTQKDEVRAIDARNARLRELAEVRLCSLSAPPASASE